MDEFVSVVWNATDEMTNGTASAVVSNGGAVAVSMDPEKGTVGISLIFQELDEKDVDEFRKALDEGKVLVFFKAKEISEDDVELDVTILKGKNAKLDETINEVNEYLRRTGGIHITGKDLVGA